MLWMPLLLPASIAIENVGPFSLEPILLQSAYFRAHNEDRRIKGMYLVGAGTHPGAGVPGVVGSAKATARIILGEGLTPA